MDECNHHLPAASWRRKQGLTWSSNLEFSSVWKETRAKGKNGTSSPTHPLIRSRANTLYSRFEKALRFLNFITSTCNQIIWKWVCIQLLRALRPFCVFIILECYYQFINSTFGLFAHLSSLITSTKWASLFSLKFLARSWIRAEWSIPVPVAPVPPAMPRLVPVPVLVLVFFSFSWSMSQRELWLARTGSSSGGLRRPLAVLGLWPGMNWMGRRKWKRQRKREGQDSEDGGEEAEEQRKSSQSERDTGHACWEATNA